jgi:hypothetical protein
MMKPLADPSASIAAEAAFVTVRGRSSLDVHRRHHVSDPSLCFHRGDARVPVCHGGWVVDRLLPTLVADQSHEASRRVPADERRSFHSGTCHGTIWCRPEAPRQPELLAVWRDGSRTNGRRQHHQCPLRSGRRTSSDSAREETTAEESPFERAIAVHAAAPEAGSFPHSIQTRNRRSVVG